MSRSLNFTDSYRASAARKRDSFANPSVGFRVAPHKRRRLVNWRAVSLYQCAAISHKEECYVIEFANDDRKPCAIN